MQVTNEAIRLAREALDCAHMSLKLVTYTEVSKCQHANQAEAPYRNDGFGGADAPLRVCLDCGLVETGWGPGYLLLTGKAVSSIARDDAYRLRTVHVYNDDKGPLLRKEVTVQQLLEKKLGVPL